MDWHLLETEDTLIITISAKWLRKMEEEELRVWRTPPRHVYTARNQAWQDDKVIATLETFLILAGYTDSEDIDDNEEFSVTIALS
jgi:hypothetical protein